MTSLNKRFTRLIAGHERGSKAIGCERGGLRDLHPQGLSNAGPRHRVVAKAQIAKQVSLALVPTPCWTAGWSAQLALALAADVCLTQRKEPAGRRIVICKGPDSEARIRIRIRGADTQSSFCQCFFTISQAVASPGSGLRRSPHSHPSSAAVPDTRLSRRKLVFSTLQKLSLVVVYSFLQATTKCHNL